MRQTRNRQVQTADQPRGQGNRGRSGSAVQIATVGNLTAEPELHYTANGTATIRFTIASNDRKFDPILGHWRDVPTLFTRCIISGAQAEQVAATLHRGHRVIVHGQLRPPSSAYRGGWKGKTAELDVEEVALSLRYTSAPVG